MTTLDIILIILFVLCVIGSAFFSVAEIAFISVQKYKLEHLIETRVEGASRVKSLINHPERLLSTILLGNNFFNTAAAALGTTIAVTMVGASGTLIATIAVTIVLLVFADTIPKTSAAHHAETLAISLSRIIRLISWIFTPVVVVLSWIATGFGKVEEKVAAIPGPVASTIVNRFKRAVPLSASAKENRDIPAFMRRVKVSERFDELKLEEPAEFAADDEDRFDIPTFLRKQAD